MASIQSLGTTASVFPDFSQGTTAEHTLQEPSTRNAGITKKIPDRHPSSRCGRCRFGTRRAARVQLLQESLQFLATHLAIGIHIGCLELGR